MEHESRVVVCVGFEEEHNFAFHWRRVAFFYLLYTPILVSVARLVAL